MIRYKTEEEIAIMREGGKKFTQGFLKEVAKKVKPGVKTDELNSYAEQLIDEAGCTASFWAINRQTPKTLPSSSLCFHKRGNRSWHSE